MRRFRDYLAERDRAQSRGTAGTRSASALGGGAMKSLDVASLSLPADTDAKQRASLFKEFGTHLSLSGTATFSWSPCAPTATTSQRS